ncbi:MAG TPA: hypothetical protein VFK06_13070 [Candidatus Angelobacter sp.]|nr:hypothetical protein [Candidatus Angelobacter sp.]
MSANECITLAPSLVTAERVGWKAFGLSCLPQAWIPAFFVIDNTFAKYITVRTDLQARISECLNSAGIVGVDVCVRSSGTSETIEQRGRLVSKTCSSTDILSTISSLSEQISQPDAANIHWIIQQHVRPARQGHLSNERRLSCEARDFVVEFGMNGEQPGYTDRIGVRHWRQGAAIVDSDLRCMSQPEVTLKLKSVALWATALPERMLFEWVWDGTRVWIVQADEARGEQGTNPNNLRPVEIPQITPNNLSMFRVVDKVEYEKYGKLRNAKLYMDIGYQMPAFYILDDAKEIQRILQGDLSGAIEEDLNELTRRPLILRTDGINIPKDKREMLPRSEGLSSSADAQKWLLEKFAKEIDKIGIANCSLCLIAHHFIPSTAAAWARAEPGKELFVLNLFGVYPKGYIGIVMTHLR